MENGKTIKKQLLKKMRQNNTKKTKKMVTFKGRLGYIFAQLQEFYGDIFAISKN